MIQALFCRTSGWLSRQTCIFGFAMVLLVVRSFIDLGGN